MTMHLVGFAAVLTSNLWLFPLQISMKMFYIYWSKLSENIIVHMGVFVSEMHCEQLSARIQKLTCRPDIN